MGILTARLHDHEIALPIVDLPIGWLAICRIALHRSKFHETNHRGACAGLD